MEPLDSEVFVSMIADPTGNQFVTTEHIDAIQDQMNIVNNNAEINHRGLVIIAPTEGAVTTTTRFKLPSKSQKSSNQFDGSMRSIAQSDSLHRQGTNQSMSGSYDGERSIEKSIDSTSLDRLNRLQSSSYKGSDRSVSINSLNRLDQLDMGGAVVDGDYEDSDGGIDSNALDRLDEITAKFGDTVPLIEKRGIDRLNALDGRTLASTGTSPNVNALDRLNNLVAELPPQDMWERNGFLQPNRTFNRASMMSRNGGTLNRTMLRANDDDDDDEESVTLLSKGSRSFARSASSSKRLGGQEEEAWNPSSLQRDFLDNEIEASNYNKQLRSASTAICVIQVLMYLIMTQQHGFNGSSTSTVAFTDKTLTTNGAILSTLITNKWQIWRLVVSIFIHSGFIDVFCNVLIQMIHGGYINLLAGSFKFNVIYFGSGLFGNLLSCLYRREVVVCGSSGSILGMLTAWAVWIAIRWKVVPIKFLWLRNCQLLFIFFSLATTLTWSYFKFHNFIQLSGASIMGILWGLLLFGNQFTFSRVFQYTLRIIVFLIIVVAYITAFYLVF